MSVIQISGATITYLYGVIEQQTASHTLVLIGGVRRWYRNRLIRKPLRSEKGMRQTEGRKLS